MSERITREEAIEKHRIVANTNSRCATWRDASDFVKAYLDQEPDAEVWKEIERYLEAIYKTTGKLHRAVTTDNRSWFLVAYSGDTGSMTGHMTAYDTVDPVYRSAIGFRDMLRKLLPPPVPTIEEAIEAYGWLLDNLPVSCDADVPLDALKGYLDAEQARGEK